MDFTIFLFLQITGFAFLIYGMSFTYQDVRAGLVVVSALIFYMLSIAAWDITRDFVETVSVNSTLDTIQQYTIHYPMQEMSQLNYIFMWVSILWIFLQVLGNAEYIVAALQFKMSELAKRMR